MFSPSTEEAHLDVQKKVPSRPSSVIDGFAELNKDRQRELYLDVSSKLSSCDGNSPSPLTHKDKGRAREIHLRLKMMEMNIVEETNISVKYKKEVHSKYRQVLRTLL